MLVLFASKKCRKKYTEIRIGLDGLLELPSIDMLVRGYDRKSKGPLGHSRMQLPDWWFLAAR